MIPPPGISQLSKPPARALARFAAALAAVAIAAAARADETTPAERAGGGLAALHSFSQGNVPFKVAADRVLYDMQDDWVTFVGNVRLTTDTLEVLGEKIAFSRRTQRLVTTGRTLLRDSSGNSWSGDSVDIDLANAAGRVENTAVSAGPFRLAAGSLVALSTNEFVATAATITTCTNAPGSWHYHLTADRVRVRPGNDMTAHGATVRLSGVPVFHLPWYWFNLDPRYGYRFEPGYRSRWGLFLLNTYTAPLYRTADRDFVLDSVTALDLRATRGVAAGESLEWFSAECGAGAAGVYGLNDLADPLPAGARDSKRHGVFFRHVWDDGDHNRFLLRGREVSDRRFLLDFFEREYEAMPEPDNHAALSHVRDSVAAGVETRFRMNRFYNYVERLPEAWANVHPVEIAPGTGLFYESQTSVGAFLRKYREDVGDLPDSEDAGRFDTWHRLTLPLASRMGAVSFVPRASYRMTAYSAHPLWDDDGGPDRGGSVCRSLGEFGAEVSLKAHSTWAGADGETRWRHIVEPYADYAFVPHPDATPDELYQFDEIDSLCRASRLRVGLRNHWHRKRGESVREVLSVDIFGDFDFDADGEGGCFRRAVLDAEAHPWENFRWYADAEYDAVRDRFGSASSRLNFELRRWTASAEYRYAAGLRNRLTARCSVPVTETWNVGASWRYEFLERNTEEVGVHFQRVLDCIGFRLNVSVRPGYDRDGGASERTDYRVSLTAWLTDFAPGNEYSMQRH